MEMVITFVKESSFLYKELAIDNKKVILVVVI
jgi:hypothetical protein